jgi:hypothetical protein
MNRQQPAIVITDFPRSLGRSVWRWYYQMMRVVARESRKASIDMMIYGTGIVRIEEDTIRHVPASEWIR